MEYNDEIKATQARLAELRKTKKRAQQQARIDTFVGWLQTPDDELDKASYLAGALRMLGQKWAAKFVGHLEER